MRKQKASDRRTTRRQRGGDELTQERIKERLSEREVTITSSPMTKKGDWKLKRQGDVIDPRAKTGGRGRSKKRSLLYNSLSLYHNKFLNYLTAEYKAEVSAFFVPVIIFFDVATYSLTSIYFAFSNLRKKK